MERGGGGGGRGHNQGTFHIDAPFYCKLFFSD